MHKFKLFLLSLVSLSFLVACSGSKDLQGSWKSQDSYGKDITIVFEEKSVTIDGKDYSYTQNGVGTANGVSYLLIRLDDNGNERPFTVVFPEKDKKTAALIIEPDDTEEPLYGTLYYVMSQTETPDYQTYGEKYMQK